MQKVSEKLLKNEIKQAKFVKPFRESFYFYFCRIQLSQKPSSKSSVFSGMIV